MTAVAATTHSGVTVHLGGVTVVAPACTDPDRVWSLMGAHVGLDWLMLPPAVDSSGTLEIWTAVPPSFQRR